MKRDTNLQLGEVLRKWRAMADLDQRAAAAKMGISASTLCRIEKGDFVPETLTFMQIMNWLLGPRDNG